MPQSPTIRMICPRLACRVVLAVPVASRGKEVRCRSCGGRVIVPSTAASPSPPATALA